VPGEPERISRSKATTAQATISLSACHLGGTGMIYGDARLEIRPTAQRAVADRIAE
jgi:hypothetical protein